MRNKQHEYILKAFLESTTPMILKFSAPELISIDSVIGGYCTQLVDGAKSVHIITDSLLSASEKNTFSKIINSVTGKEKSELVIYYRLAILAEGVILQYK